MSDFTSSFWSWYVAGITLVGVFACVALLWWTHRMNTEAKPSDSTGHVWDGNLTEQNHPLPRWWVFMFGISCLFGLLYLALYPGLGSFKGTLGWSQQDQHAREQQAHEARIAPIYAAFAGQSVPELAANTEARAIGDRLFMNNCAQCHGSDARGSKGFPNLADGHWNWGGTPEAILETIADGRVGMMPPMAEAVGSAQEVRAVANYVLGLSGGAHDSALAAAGKEKFLQVCAACHGESGTGNAALGAPDLSKGIFTHGPDTEAHVVQMINEGKSAEMPAWKERFSPEQLRVLAAYVWGLGGGVAPQQ
ncbi:cytochrome-c oxidase, cbb3-type subunit III [Comamonas sp. NLF-1-9]|uniref:cytochrome-c oxidase, cbb3-type subunit III n=1 Tax=Comamonas sp. NLF-1-9 TaxID=2853163 RepID=UPI001C48FC54|nr:cytochrome-c oxidase, cbb3-type subunit III [Comamonas sp. NLF-1-9]QXL85597.1 cytochrome-c oxidase, cbb3-type subunit III [Comamonas sp. NLF-1-9]